MVTSLPDDGDASAGQVSHRQQQQRHRGGMTRAWGMDNDDDTCSCDVCPLLTLKMYYYLCILLFTNIYLFLLLLE